MKKLQVDQSKISIIELDKTQYKGFELHFKYQTDTYYDVLRDEDSLFSIRLVKKPFKEEILKEFVDHLFADHLEDPSAFSINSPEAVLGYLEVDREAWHNRLRITELLILPEYLNKGYGSLLMQHAKAIAAQAGYREIVLETQTCNTIAIDFYLGCGFVVNGIDLTAYSNEDVMKKEVRIEMVCQLS
ncbi:MAG: GNAT family N-acetyltransferase [Anaerolineaceae bacterium]|nr:GNAT family N-acetyltransferase [Anaerolineaceae bacterium]